MLMSATAIGVGRLGMPLSMQALDFPVGAIASVTAMSGLVAVPIALLIGALSDRLGRRRFLALIYVLVASGMLILSAADQVWHFWLAATLMFVALSTNGALTSALATDILPREALSRSLPRITALNSAAAVLSFASTGFVMDTFGATTLYIAAAALALIAALQLRRVTSHSQRVEARVAHLNRYDRPAVQSAIHLNAPLPDTHQLRRMESSS
jgi:UMF1 family MFS transporter